MSLVYYYGNPEMAPQFETSNLVDFSESTLIEGFDEGPKETVDDYNEFISIIFKY